jgi:hypothetical protein
MFFFASIWLVVFIVCLCVWLEQIHLMQNYHTRSANKYHFWSAYPACVWSAYSACFWSAYPACFWSGYPTYFRSVYQTYFWSVYDVYTILWCPYFWQYWNEIWSSRYMSLLIYAIMLLVLCSSMFQLVLWFWCVYLLTSRVIGNKVYYVLDLEIVLYFSLLLAVPTQLSWIICTPHTNGYSEMIKMKVHLKKNSKKLFCILENASFVSSTICQIFSCLLILSSWHWIHLNSNNLFSRRVSWAFHVNMLLKPKVIAWIHHKEWFHRCVARDESDYL